MGELVRGGEDEGGGVGSSKTRRTSKQPILPQQLTPPARASTIIHPRYLHQDQDNIQSIEQSLHTHTLIRVRIRAHMRKVALTSKKRGQTGVAREVGEKQ